MSISLFYLVSCGSSVETLTKEDNDLIMALGGAEYALLTDAERYDAAEYLMRRGDITMARAIYEDIVTHNRQAVTVKYKLALIYLKMDAVEFTKKIKKGKLEKFTLNGKELGEKVLNEIVEQNPWYLPVYSQLMILEAERGNAEGVKKWYEKAKSLNEDYLSSDYRVGFLSMSDPLTVEDGKKALIKGQKSFADLYLSYKSLGGIQKVQKLDTIALESFNKAVKTKTEALDLFFVYYEMATVCESLYKTREDENYRSRAIMYGCMSAQHFPKYKPSLVLVAKLADLPVAKDTTAPLEAYQAAVSELAKTVIPEKDQIVMSLSQETVIPESVLIDDWSEKHKDVIKKKSGLSSSAIYIGGGIVLGAGAAVFGLSLIEGKSTKSSFGRPPAFPTPD
jgi:tetratricopeptide (TPR) repeat protein